jgi:HEPN domain-containing protein
MATPEAERLLRVARRDLNMARRLLDPEVEEASWGWAAQQCLEKTLKAWLHIVGTKPPQTHDLARLLLLLQDSGVDITELLALRAFTTFAVQCRYDDEPENLGLDRAAWCNRAEALIEHVQNWIG